MQFVSTKEFAEAHGVAERTVRSYCAQGKILGAQRIGRKWCVPTNATLPTRRNANESISPLLETLRREKECGMKGGIYHHTQIALTYNSNHIEGSCLTEEQTRYIF